MHYRTDMNSVLGYTYYTDILRRISVWHFLLAGWDHWRNSLSSSRTDLLSEDLDSSLYTAKMAKIIEKITDLEKEGKKWFSLEFFPPKFDHAVEPLVERVANFSRLGPLFVDITWGAGGSTADRTIELSDIFQNVVGVEVPLNTFVRHRANCLPRPRCTSRVPTCLRRRFCRD